MLYQTLSHTLKLAPHESPSRRTLNNYAIFYAKPSRKTLNNFGKPSTTLIIPKIPAHKKHTLVIHYLPTLALSKSGSGLKHPLTLSPPVRAPRFILQSLKYRTASFIHITFVMMCCFQQQFHYTHAQKKCKRYFLSA